MVFNPDQITPSGKTYRQIDADMEAYVRAANEVLAQMRGVGAHWWNYAVSHNTFELVVGDCDGADNVVICLNGCSAVAGPTAWQGQELQVQWHSNREDPNKGWEYILRDDAAQFRVAASVFRWARNFDLRANHSMYFGRGRSASPPLSASAAETRFLRWLKLYGRGMISREELTFQTLEVLAQLSETDHPKA